MATNLRENPGDSSTFWICGDCGDLNPVSASPSCGRCGHAPKSPQGRSASVSLALTLTALILYVPANFLPFMSMELYGARSSATIWEGVVQLADAGSFFIAGVVLVASIVVPLLKLAALFVLARESRTNRERYWKTRIYRWIEALGRWSMLDIFLLAVLVAIMKLGPWTRVEPGPGAALFALVVIFTMLASASFHSQLIWRGTDGRESADG